MKRCSKCKTDKPVTEFSRSAKAADGFHPHCKQCTSEQHKAAYAQRGRRSWLNDKTCKHCLKLLPRAAFRVREDGKVHHQCKDCEKEIAAQHSSGLKRCNICREWLKPSAFHPSKLRVANTACASCTRIQIRGYGQHRREHLLMKEYGITLTQYDELVARQGGNCPVCLEPLPANRAGHVDHAHSGPFKGRIRAIVHGQCNRTVLHDHEDSAILRRAADLIDNPLTDWVVPGLPSSELRKEARKQRKLK